MDAANAIRACRCSRYVSNPDSPSRHSTTLAALRGGTGVDE